VTDASARPDPRPAFAHASEAELARILDFYDVRWRYEPDTFPIGWSLDGDVVESFSPDFYLPDLDLYLELTTLKQSLVRKKNRKLRRLRELYPDVRIKLFYARDFRMLLLKFGRLALAAELSGTVGQATPPRVHQALIGDERADRREGALARTQAEADADAAADDDAGADDGIGLDPARLLTADVEAGRTPRGRRRGRRRRAAARAAAIAASAAPHAGGVTLRPPNSVSSAGTLPA
jgi:hypothetical protein